MLAPVIASLFLINYVKKSRNLLKVRCGWWVGGGWWSKGILEFRFGPNLGLRLEAWTKLNNISISWNIKNILEYSKRERFHIKNGEQTNYKQTHIYKKSKICLTPTKVSCQLTKMTGS